MLHKIILISFLILNSFALANDGKKIDFLLNEIKNSNHVFIRNGEEHTSQQAYEHIKFKTQLCKEGLFLLWSGKRYPY